ncbi:MAG: ATP-binding cassette domain-containing protein [Pseudomonadota bacterium]|nr:ATP-binding cassette domain-containing protein [Pseudomonadota bacterium]
MAGISLSGVCKSYAGGADVIRNVDLDIADGEFCVFVGPSGCGKSTLLRMIAGLEDISRGTLAIGGREMNRVPSSRRGVAMVFQSYALFPHMTIRQNMAFGLSLAKVDRTVIAAKVLAAARILQLEHLLDRFPKALSGGQRQRVAIGRAIVREPGVFLFDEPLSNLDAALRVQTRFEIARLHRDFGRASTIYVTHDQVEAMTLADRILLLNSGEAVQRHGSIAQCGAPLELYHRPRNRFVAGFIGSPCMNFLPARLVSAAPARAVLTLDSGETLEAAVDAERLAPGSAVTVGARPEDITLAPGAHALVREVLWQERLGEATYLYLAGPAADAPLVLKAPGNTHAGTGQRIAIHLRAEVLHVFDDQGNALPRCIEDSDLTIPQAA